MHFKKHFIGLPSKETVFIYFLAASQMWMYTHLYVLCHTNIMLSEALKSMAVNLLSALLPVIVDLSSRDAGNKGVCMGRGD